jgi:hypothetical protein
MKKEVIGELPAVEELQVREQGGARVRIPALKVASVRRSMMQIEDAGPIQVPELAAVGRSGLMQAPRASFVSYMSGGLIHVGLVDRCAFVFPIDLIEGLRSARTVDLRQVRIESDGLVLHWTRLQLRLLLPLLMRGVFGSPDWMRRRLPDRPTHPDPGGPSLRKQRVPLSTANS